MFDGLFDFFGRVLNAIYTVVPSFGLSIMILTLIVMVVLMPLTLKSTKSMLALQRVQPELKRLQEKYKGDREKLNQEIMAFYQANQINPVGGCLPILAQAPVFIILYRTVSGLTNRVGGLGSGVGQIVGQSAAGQELLARVNHEQFFAPKHLAESSELFQALNSQTEMKFLGIDLSRSLSQVFSTEGLLQSLPYVALVAIILVTSLVQQRQIQGRSQSSAMPPQQQAIMKFLPFMLPVFSVAFPAALSLYFITSNVFRIGQQALITRKFYRDEDGRPIDHRALASAEADKKANGAGKATSGGGATAGKPGTSARSQAAQRKAAERKESVKGSGVSGSSSSSTARKQTTARRRSGAPRPKGRS